MTAPRSSRPVGLLRVTVLFALVAAGLIGVGTGGGGTDQGDGDGDSVSFMPQVSAQEDTPREPQPAPRDDSDPAAGGSDPAVGDSDPASNGTAGGDAAGDGDDGGAEPVPGAPEAGPGLVPQPEPAKPAVNIDQGTLDALVAARRLGTDADRALRERDWEAAIAAYGEIVQAVADHPELGAWADNANYNLACAHARAGRADEAARAFVESVRHGLRQLLAPVPGRPALTFTRGLSLEHLLEDPDLDPIRTHPDYVAALERLVARSELHTRVVGDADSGPLPAVLVLAPADLRIIRAAHVSGRTAEEALATLTIDVWAAAAADRSVVLASTVGPVRPVPTIPIVVEAPVAAPPEIPAWVPSDGNDTFALAAIRDAVATLRADPRVDPERIYLAAIGPAAGQAAYAGWLDAPNSFAGVAIVGGRFHRHWHADAVAELPAALAGRAFPPILIDTENPSAEALFAAAGLTVARTNERRMNGVAKAALDLWLD